MEEADFWKLLAPQDEKDDFDWNEKYKRLFQQLVGLSRQDVIDFTVHFSRAQASCFIPGVLCGAYLIYEGNLTHDSFLDFSDCLVALGKETMNRVLIEPDSLGGHLELAYCPSMFFSMIAIKAHNKHLKNFELSLDEYLPQLATGGFEEIEFRGKRGLHIISLESLSILTPRLLEKFGNRQTIC